MSNFTDQLDDDVMVTLELDDGVQVDCEIITIFESEGQDYIVLEPQETANDPDCEEAELYVYRYFEDEEGNCSLENIQDDDEYERVHDCIDELLDEAYYEQL